jgi:hypothetical protein
MESLPRKKPTPNRSAKFVPERVNFELRPPSVSLQPRPYLNGQVQLMAALFVDRHTGRISMLKMVARFCGEKKTPTSTIPMTSRFHPGTLALRGNLPRKRAPEADFKLTTIGNVAHLTISLRSVNAFEVESSRIWRNEPI